MSGQHARLRPGTTMGRIAELERLAAGQAEQLAGLGQRLADLEARQGTGELEQLQAEARRAARREPWPLAAGHLAAEIYHTEQLPMVLPGQLPYDD